MQSEFFLKIELTFMLGGAIFYSGVKIFNKLNLKIKGQEVYYAFNKRHKAICVIIYFII